MTSDPRPAGALCCWPSVLRGDAVAPWGLVFPASCIGVFSRLRAVSHGMHPDGRDAVDPPPSSS
jgi:hypothetical protein